VLEIIELEILRSRNSRGKKSYEIKKKININKEKKNEEKTLFTYFFVCV